ncbi:MAG: HAMP domain-containing histidine kinase [Humibacillus sp.]|nr:HAMP domain-containing histidine kinase [Humibacillus sp.]MDN5779405.1 HAMP domain-containing histidine kinase [Humibacillus sp.]
MRRLLGRLTLVAAGVTAGLTTVVVAAVLWWAVTERPGQLLEWVSTDLRLTAAMIVALVLAAGIVGVLGAVVGTLALRRRAAGAAADLVDLASRFSAGEARLSPVRSGVREIDHVSDIIARRAHDMTKSLAAERDFAADASHQLRTPLTALLMRLEEISFMAEKSVVKEEASIAIAQVERLTRVVDDLLGRGRAAGGPTPVVSLDTTIAALQREWQPAFEQARRSVRVRGERGLFVRSTPVALSQVLSTLLENSLVHGRGTVDVHARRSGPSVVVEVSDQGDGVSPAMAPHIFERSVSSGTGASTGLGLALARDLAESNGGRLDLVQAQPARFALFLSESDDA